MSREPRALDQGETQGGAALQQRGGGAAVCEILPDFSFISSFRVSQVDASARREVQRHVDAERARAE